MSIIDSTVKHRESTHNVTTPEWTSQLWASTAIRDGNVLHVNIGAIRRAAYEKTPAPTMIGMSLDEFKALLAALNDIKAFIESQGNL